MLNQIRSAVRSWLAGILIALLVVSFAVWGVSDAFVGGATGAVVRVGETRVTTQEFRTLFNRRLQQLGQETGSALTAEEAVDRGVDRQLLGLVARDATIEEAARDMGLWVSDDLVAEELGRIEAFRNPITGEFDMRAYLGALRNNNETPERFEESVRDNILRYQLLTAITAGVSAPDLFVSTRARYEAERRRVTLVRVPMSAAADPGQPTDDQLAAYYEENQSRYAAPEMRAITIFLLDLDQMVSGYDFTEEEMRAMYEAERANLETPERRTVVEMSAPSAELAAEIAQRLEAGEEPDAIAAELSVPEPVLHDEVTRDGFVDRLVAEQAFTLEEGAISEPFEGALTWKIVRVDAVEEAAVQSFEEAEPELRMSAARELATADWIERITNYNRLRDRTGATIAEAAQEIGVAAISTGPFDERGRDLTGYRYETLTAHAEILESAFATGENSETGLTPIGDSGYFALRVDEIIESAPRPLEDIRDDVVTHWIAEQRAENLGEIADIVRESLETGQPGDIVAQTASADAEAVDETIARNLGLIAGVDPRLERLIFSASVGDVVIGGAPDSGAVIARVEEIQTPEEYTEAAETRAREALDQQLAADVAELYRRALQTEYEARIFPNEVARATGVTDGT